MTERRRFIVGFAALIAATIWVAGAAYAQGVEDWQYQLAGLANPFLGRPSPGSSVIVGLILSAGLGLGVAVARRFARPVPGGRPWVRIRWWLALVAGWAAYGIGAALVLAGGGPTTYAGTVQVLFGPPLDRTAEVQATCRSVVGHPGIIAEVIPAVDGLLHIDLRNVATGQSDPSAIPVTVRLTNDGIPNNEFVAPNLPDRPAPFLVHTNPDGSTEAQPPISFVTAYDYVTTAFAETGHAGSVELTGTRFEAPAQDSSLHWEHLVIDDDPWPKSYRLTYRWTCETPAR
jgi:hypothetical protein